MFGNTFSQSGLLIDGTKELRDIDTFNNVSSFQFEFHPSLSTVSRTGIRTTRIGFFMEVPRSLTASSDQGNSDPGVATPRTLSLSKANSNAVQDIFIEIWPPNWPFRFTWRLSRDHLIPQVSFPIRAWSRHSRDVIGHVINRFAICYFLLMSHCTESLSSTVFQDRDIRPHPPPHQKNPCAYTDTQTHAASAKRFLPRDAL